MMINANVLTMDTNEELEARIQGDNPHVIMIYSKLNSMLCFYRILTAIEYKIDGYEMVRRILRNIERKWYVYLFK